MEKLKVTAQQRANAVEALTVMWPSVPKKNVAPELGDWCNRWDEPLDCGAVACFGGWCAVYPKFVDQGVKRTYSGRPVVPGTPGVEMSYDNSASRFLFGDGGMFRARMDDDERGTDHAVVSKRLRKLIRESVVVRSQS